MVLVGNGSLLHRHLSDRSILVSSLAQGTIGLAAADSPYPTPSQLAHYIHSQEIALLSKAHPSLPVAEIFRYGAIIGAQCHYVAKGHSCRAQARHLINDQEQAGLSVASGLLIGAGELSASTGRFQRYWHAPAGGLWLTVLLVNTLSPTLARLLPLMAGLACCQTVRHFGLPASLKWVNDVLVHGRKVVGVLTESFRSDVSGEEYVLLGIGLNVNNRHFPSELTGLASSMATEAGHDFDLPLVACDLLAKLRWYYGLLVYLDEQQQGESSLFMEFYRHSCDSVGRQVRYGFDVQQKPLYQAQVAAIADDGSLVLQLADGVIHESGGEIVYI